MAIHFRSQIVNQEIKGTVIDASKLGWCCDGSSTTQKTRANCQGYPFILNATDANQCAATNANCPNNFTGVIPGACCYWKLVNGNYVQECASAESYEACGNLHQGFDEGLQYSFYPGQYCQNDGGSVVCNGVKRVYGDDTNCNPDDSTDCFDANNLLGNCCHNPLEGRICSITTKPECGNGVWSPPKNGAVMSCINGAPCNGVYFSGPLNYPTTTTIEQVTNSTSEIEKLPQIGDYYQGGIFVGIFNPGTPINSDGGSVVYGNASTGNASDYRARAGIGYGRTGWILIADLEDHVVDSNYTGINLFDNIPFMSSNIIPDSFVSSTYDGLYNTIENAFNEYNFKEYSLYNKIRSYSSNGFTDWYLPSQDELALYFKNIKLDTQLFNGYSIPEGSYLSSTLFSLGNQRKFNDTYFNYTQQATTDSYGKVNLLPVTEKAKIKLFRRIYLGPEISNTLEPENCTNCLRKALDLYLKGVAAEEKSYRDHERMINQGIDENGNSIAGGWTDCWKDAFTGFLEDLSGNFKIEALLAILAGVSVGTVTASRETYWYVLEFSKCSLSFKNVPTQIWAGGKYCSDYIHYATYYNLEDVKKAQEFIRATGTSARNTFEFRVLPQFAPVTFGIGTTVGFMNALRYYAVGGITGAISRLIAIIASWNAISALLVGLTAFELARLFRAMQDALACLQIKNEELKQHYERLYGKSSCKIGAPAGKKCNTKCTTLDCTGRMGVLLAEWRKAYLECCSKACLSDSDKRIFCSPKSIPPDPGLKGTDIITPKEPGSTPLGRELLGISDVQTNTENIITN